MNRMVWMNRKKRKYSAFGPVHSVLYSLRLCASAVFPYLCLFVLWVSSTTAASAQTWCISVNPYRGVDWKNVQQVRGQFHIHTTESDGRNKPADVIDHYRRLGYRVLALTDHDHVTWPWTQYDRDPKPLGMLAVPGNELSSHHHTLSLFCRYPYPVRNDYLRDQRKAIDEVQRLGGLTVLAHPGRYWNLKRGKVPDSVRTRYVDLFKSFDSLIAMEVFNQANRYPEDRALWDALLGAMMPARPIWGMANDDSHTRAHVGLNSTILLLDQVETKPVRQALEAGRFFFTTLTTHRKDQRDHHKTPIIRRIDCDPRKGIIRLTAVCDGKPVPFDGYRWITAGGKLVSVNEKLDLNDTPGIDRYVRLEIRGPGGTLFTQPFGIEKVRE